MVKNKLPELEKGKRLYGLGQSICGLAVCAPKDMKPEEVEAECNRESPTGIHSRWAVSKPADVQPNPIPCPDDETRQHFALEC